MYLTFGNVYDENTFSFLILFYITLSLTPYTITDSSAGYMGIASGWILIRHVLPGDTW